MNYIELEYLHLSEAYRTNKALMDQLLTDDYKEYGSDGSFFNKENILARIPLATSQRYFIDDYQSQDKGEELSASYILKAFDNYELTYKLRCQSHWIKQDIWKLNRFDYEVLEITKSPAMFIDLQGTLGGYGLGDISQFEFFDNALVALKKAVESDYKVFITTNQSAIEKGIITDAEYKKHELRIKEEMAKESITLDGIYCCPHKFTECTCKKPLPGLVEQAANDYDLNIKDSFVIGDMGASDMMLARNIGSKSILVTTGVGQGSLNEFRDTWEGEPTYVAASINEAIDYVLGENNERQNCVSK